MYRTRRAGAEPAGGTPGPGDAIERCLSGDQSAWEAIVRTYWKRVFHIAYKFVGRYDEAEDLTQEIFVRLLSALPTYDRRANFEAWLTSVSRNHCIDHYRRVRREQARITREVDPGELGVEDPLRRPDVILEKRDQVGLIRRALVRLSPTLREAVALRDVHELSYQEIAARLKLPEGTVKSRINRGRKELGRYLQGLQRAGRGTRAEEASHGEA